MTIDAQKLREIADAADRLCYHEDGSGERVYGVPIIHRMAFEKSVTPGAVLGLLDTLDAQTAEIAEAKGQIEHLDRQNAGLRAQHDRDSKTLREYAQARDGLRRACAALEAEKTRLRHALRWTSAALQEACRRPTIITEKDLWRIDHETRTTGEILAAADAALSGEFQ